METYILERMYRLHKKIGFPPVVDIKVVSRENTGVGRYTDLLSDAVLQIETGLLGNGNYSYLEIEGVSDYVGVTISIKNRKLEFLEICTIGGNEWTAQKPSGVLRMN